MHFYTKMFIRWDIHTMIYSMHYVVVRKLNFLRKVDTISVHIFVDKNVEKEFCGQKWMFAQQVMLCTIM